MRPDDQKPVDEHQGQERKEDAEDDAEFLRIVETSPTSAGAGARRVCPSRQDLSRQDLGRRGPPNMSLVYANPGHCVRRKGESASQPCTATDSNIRNV